MQQTKKESELSILKGKTAVVTGSTSGIGLGARGHSQVLAPNSRLAGAMRAILNCAMLK
jgi:NAD(P)-dependent dehydrogenase (short-subunit alcohol dehydrogenase family)